MITRIGTYSQIKGVSVSSPCLVATTGPITLSNTQTIDGVSVSVGDRVLVKNQISGSTNGIYVVNGGAWDRAVDMSLNDDVFQGLQVYINSGTTTGDKVFILNTPNPIVLGTSNLNFVIAVASQITGSGTSGQIAYFNGTNSITSSENVLPVTDNTGVVGNASFTWSNGQFTNLTVDSTMTVTSTLNVRAAIDLADADVLRFGSSDDFQMYYDGVANEMEFEMEAACTQLRIHDNGTTRFTFEKSTGNLIATGAVTAGGNYLINNLTASKKGYTFQSPASNWGPQISGLYFTPTNAIDAATTFTVELWNGTGSTITPLTIADTGAATFSSTISATGTIRTDGASNGLLLRNGFTAEIVNPNLNTRDIQFNQDTNGTVVFKANGKVGIGTASPVNKLSVLVDGGGADDGIRIGVGSQGDGIKIVQRYLSDRVVATLGQSNYGVVTDSGSLRLYDVGGTETVRLSGKSGYPSFITSGNVGIGTASPNNILDITLVNSNVYPKVNRSSTSYEAGWKLSTGGVDSWYLGLRSADGVGSYHFYSYTTNSSVASITSGGNVLIGTTTDTSYKLYVLGAVGVSSSVTANNYIANTQGLNVSGYGFLTQTISGQMTILGHNLAASNSVANQVNVVNSGWYSSMIRMYYSEGIAFHTSLTSYSAGDVYPMAATERMRITSGGNVLIGTTTDSGQKLQVNGVLRNGGSTTYWYSGSDGGGMYLETVGTTTATRVLRIQGVNDAGNRYSAIKLQAGAEVISFETADAERMRIASNGDITYGVTTAYDTNLIWRSNFTSTVFGRIFATGAARVVVVAGESNGVQLTSGATSWTSNSDERLKDINCEIENAVEKLLTLRTVHFSWKADKLKKENLGLIAQDVEKQFPQLIDKAELAITGEGEQKDETQYLGIRYTELIPVLVKAIQELKAENDTLKYRIETIEQA